MFYFPYLRDPIYRYFSEGLKANPVEAFREKGSSVEAPPVPEPRRNPERIVQTIPRSIPEVAPLETHAEYWRVFFFVFVRK